MNELPLFRTTDPETSREAAATVDRARSQAIVLEAFRLHGQMDDRALVDVLPASVSESRARGARCELARAGLLEVCGYIGQPRRRIWRIKS